MDDAEGIRGDRIGAHVGGPTAGGQDDEPMYVIYNFSDATYSQQVGVLRPTCRMYGGGHGYYVQYTLEGELTNFQIQEDAGACPGLTPQKGSPRIGRRAAAAIDPHEAGSGVAASGAFG